MDASHLDSYLQTLSDSRIVYVRRMIPIQALSIVLHDVTGIWQASER